MPLEHDRPTETSLLLPRAHNEEEEREEEEEEQLPIEGQELPDTGILDGGAEGWSEEAARARRFSGPEGWAQDAGARRRFSSSAGRQKQYEGMPEVRARMKYILPALAIGVC